MNDILDKQYIDKYEVLFYMGLYTSKIKKNIDDYYEVLDKKLLTKLNKFNNNSIEFTMYRSNVDGNIYYISEANKDSFLKTRYNILTFEEVDSSIYQNVLDKYLIRIKNKKEQITYNGLNFAYAAILFFIMLFFNNNFSEEIFGDLVNNSPAFEYQILLPITMGISFILYILKKYHIKLIKNRLMS